MRVRDLGDRLAFHVDGVGLETGGEFLLVLCAGDLARTDDAAHPGRGRKAVARLFAKNRRWKHYVTERESCAQAATEADGEERVGIGVGQYGFGGPGARSMADAATENRRIAAFV